MTDQETKEKKDQAEQVETTEEQVVATTADNKDELKKEILDQKIKGYIEAVGRRKTSTSRVRISSDGKGEFVVNGKKMEEYFPTAELKKIVEDVFAKLRVVGKFSVSVVVAGGGIHSQAEAVRHGLARTMVALVPKARLELKKIGFLKRDPRTKERRKFGLKKARKAAQWSKR